MASILFIFALFNSKKTIYNVQKYFTISYTYVDYVQKKFPRFTDITRFFKKHNQYIQHFINSAVTFTRSQPPVESRLEYSI